MYVWYVRYSLIVIPRQKFRLPRIHYIWTEPLPLFIFYLVDHTFTNIRALSWMQMSVWKACKLAYWREYPTWQDLSERNVFFYLLSWFSFSSCPTLILIYENVKRVEYSNGILLYPGFVPGVTKNFLVICQWVRDKKLVEGIYLFTAIEKY